MKLHARALPAAGRAIPVRNSTDEREVPEYVPSHFKVIVHAGPKMSRRDCEISLKPLPPMCETAEHDMPTIAYLFFRNLQ
jgi:hypothetical protein